VAGEGKRIPKEGFTIGKTADVRVDVRVRPKGSRECKKKGSGEVLEGRRGGETYFKLSDPTIQENRESKSLSLNFTGET